MAKSGVYRFKQQFFPAGFVQKSHRAGFQRSRFRIVVGMRRDEHDGDLRMGSHQMTLKLQSTHAGHANVNDKALRIVQLIRIQELLRRSETQCAKAE
jgi:hypothetical protein